MNSSHENAPQSTTDGEFQREDEKRKQKI